VAQPISATKVCCGSWLCENAKRFDGDRRSYSSKTVVTVKLASELNFKNELKNVILAACRSFAFLHSQVITGNALIERKILLSPQQPKGDLGPN